MHVPVDLSASALFAMLAAGIAVSALSWWLAITIDAVPPEDRCYRDRPPVAFRLVWWPLRWLAHYLARVLPAGVRRRALARLRLAGLDYAITPEELVAAQGVAAAAAALAADGILSAFQRPGDAWLVVAAAVGYAAPALWLRDRIQQRRRDTLKTLPFFLDVITLCVEAGLNLTGALAQAVAKGPAGALRDELARVLRDVRAGKPRLDALHTMADRMNAPAITGLVAALVQADSMGMSLGPVLRAQAEQRRAERFTRAEKLAMEAPVKLLFPLIAFIFPCTFGILAFPIAMKFMQMGF
jgi:tight adherence protein C